MPSPSSESSFAGDNLDEAEQVAAAQLTTGGSTIVTRSMARRASGAQTVTRDEGSLMISTNDAEVEAVGDILSYMYLFESSSASDSDARPYSFTVSGTQAVASTDSTKTLFQLPPIRLLYMPSYVMMSTTTQLLYCMLLCSTTTYYKLIYVCTVALHQAIIL